MEFDGQPVMLERLAQLVLGPMPKEAPTYRLPEPGKFATGLNASSSEATVGEKWQLIGDSVTERTRANVYVSESVSQATMTAATETVNLSSRCTSKPAHR